MCTKVPFKELINTAPAVLSIVSTFFDTHFQLTCSVFNETHASNHQRLCVYL